jgi:coenzyme F420-0:L-glutamate ligase/coenzyme F420-1:gamma-L-glutamate ligase
MLLVVPLPGMPEVRPGDDLARLLLEAVRRAGLVLADGDVLAVTSKVVAKAEGRLVPLPDDQAGRERALAEAVAAETARVVARRGRLVIAETRHGLVGANALVDASNAGGDRLVLLPADPDASAARLRADLAALDGHDVAVVVTDTLGRPWRLGQTDVAVGLAGMGALDDWRGRADGDGRPLEVTEVAVADEVAAAADLVKGKASRVPAALLRGVRRPAGAGRARDLVRAPADDLFRTAGTAEDLLAFLAGPPPPAGFLPAPVDQDTIRQAVAAAQAVPLPGGQRLQVAPVPAGARPACLAALSPTPPALAAAPVLLACGLAGSDAPGAELAAGGAVRTLALGLHALGIGAVFQPAAGPAQAEALAAALRPVPWRPLGLLAAGHPAVTG